MASTPDLLSETSLDWALTHLQKFGDTDLFPVPFELDAIAHSWNRLRPILANTDLAEYRARAGRRFLVPKPGMAFRVGMQLDPIDAAVFTACVYEVADAVEKC